MRRREETRNLECELTDSELLEHGQVLSAANQKLAEIEDEKRRFSANIKAKMEEQQSKINKESHIIATGKDWRDVKCVWSYDF